MKLGVNPLKMKETNLIQFFDCFKTSNDCIDEEGNLEKQKLLKLMMDFIERHLKQSDYVIFDKISLLESMGFSEKEIILLLRNIIKQVKEKDGILVLRCRKMSTLDKEMSNEDIVDTLTSWISHQASLNLVVKPLSTGKSINVTGNISSHWTNENDILHSQFRVEEKDVKLFAKGTSSAVL